MVALEVGQQSIPAPGVPKGRGGKCIGGNNEQFLL